MNRNIKIEIKDGIIVVDDTIKIGIAKYGDYYTLITNDFYHNNSTVNHIISESEDDFKQKIKEYTETFSYPVFMDDKLICIFKDYDMYEKFIKENPNCVSDVIRDENPHFNLNGFIK